jgi:hypothetical protein
MANKTFIAFTVCALLLCELIDPADAICVTRFEAGDLRYDVHKINGKVSAVEVRRRSSSTQECAAAALSSAEAELEKRWPLGANLGHDEVSIVPTSGKRRDTFRFTNAVAIVSVFTARNPRCELFDRATVFYWLDAKGTLTAMDARALKLDGKDTGVDRYVLTVGDRQFTVNKDDFDAVKIGDTVELRYTVQTGFPAHLARR